MEKSNQKKALVLSIIGIVTLIAVVVGATYAYFIAQGDGTGNINVNATTNTTDNLSFQVGEAISLTANQEDFAQGMGNKSGSTYARAILTANNATNTATRNYYVYLNITSNDFEYTTADEQAEILLKVTDPEGSEVTTLGSLERKTSGTGDNQVTGFDITTQTGLITIADNYEITSTGTEEQEWKIEVIFANLDSDQNKNTGKSFNANLIIREDSPIGITEVSTSNITSNSITLTVDAESENTITKYYYAKNEEEYIESDSNTYTFSGLDAATSYTLKVYAVDNEGYQSAVYSTEAKTEDPTLANVCPEGGNLASCIQTYYTTYNEGTGGLYLHDGVGTYGVQEAGDGSYRYSGANPNNYVCFGATGADSQNEDNQYRIIGVFNNQVKLIKATSYGSYALEKDYSTQGNAWDATTKPDIYTTLNTTYYNSLESEWQNLIANSTWQVGGFSYNNLGIAKEIYDVEVGAGQSGYVETMKIGLMYVSDYGYGASPEKWTQVLAYVYPNGRDYGENNWLYLHKSEWVISRQNMSSRTTFLIYGSYGGNIYPGSFVHDTYVVRPSFYLESSVEFLQGDGTKQNPYRIVV